MGENMFRLKDRKGAELCLGMTHEEVMTSIARNELRSYKQLPQIWYQIQTKFRDEPRPKSGLLRVRQFTMKDSYSFDIDAAGLDKSYDLHDAVYRKHLHALRAEVCRRRCRLRRDGRLAVAGVHGLHRRRRRPDRQLPGVRLRGEYEKATSRAGSR
jgi:prolyl-tRNA synthetase